MPNCAALVLSGARKGLPCTRNAANDQSRCVQHARSFAANPQTVAMDEIVQFKLRHEHAFEDEDMLAQFCTFMDQRGRHIWTEAREEALTIFPYGPLIPERFMRVIRGDEAPPLPLPRNPIPIAQRAQRRRELMGRAERRQQRRQAVVDAHVQDLEVERLRVWCRTDLLRALHELNATSVPMALRVIEPFRRRAREGIVRGNLNGRRLLFNQVMEEQVLHMMDEIAHMTNRQFLDWLFAHRPQRRADEPLGELQQFARDTQNVHTTHTVYMVNQVVQRILRIPVPLDYRWNTHVVSKTVGEIVVDCKLTAHEMVEMMNRYVRDDDVYEMGKGIYGKVLDGVWQYIRNSPDKAQLCAILKQELKDNVGMCAQGNLSRLCNVLAGYMEGIGSQESVTERLGRELPKLMDIESVDERMEKAKVIMQSVALPETEWQPWLDALVM